MEVTAPCTRLMMSVLVLLGALFSHSCFAESVFPRVIPNRLQFFDYDKITVNCELDKRTEWRVMTKFKQNNSAFPSPCNTWVPFCTIAIVFERHSGEYWCENEAGQSSSTVNIAVTDGFVILDIPAHPVMEGQDVILHCRNKKTQSQHIWDFYKNKIPIGTLYNNNLTIHNVSKSDEGFYKCSISGAGESPESWLAVVSQSINLTPSTPAEADSSQAHSSYVHVLLWIVAAATVFMIAFLLFVLRTYFHRKHKDSGKDRSDSHCSTYAVINKQRKDQESGGENTGDVLYASVTVKKRQERQASRATTESSLQDDRVIYSLVTF